MPKYALLDSEKNIIREIVADEAPPDPVGKGWYWMEIVEAIPVPQEGQVLEPVSVTIDEVNEVVIREAKVVDAKITKADVAAERDRRLEKKPIIKLDGVGDVTVRLTSDYVNSIQSLALSAMVKVIRNELGITYTFRDEENVNWSLTPDQVLNLMVAIELEIRDIIEASWLIKDDDTTPNTLKELKKDPRWP